MPQTSWRRVKRMPVSSWALRDLQFLHTVRPKATTAVLTVSSLVPCTWCYLFSKTLMDRAKAADTHLAHLLEVSGNLHALQSVFSMDYELFPSLGVYCESLVFGVHFAPMGCNFWCLLTWYVGEVWAHVGWLGNHNRSWPPCSALRSEMLSWTKWLSSVQWRLVPTNVPNTFKWKHHTLCLSAPHSLIYLFFHSFVKKKRLVLSLLYDTFFFLALRGM